MNAFNPVQDHRLADRRADGAARHGDRHARRRRACVSCSSSSASPATAAERYPHEFSGGMRQRAAIAMALACDAEGAARRRADDRARRDGAGADPRAAASSHADELGLDADPGHARPAARDRRSCDRAAVMYAGEIVEVGPTDALYRDPRHPYTRMLFDAMPDLDGDRRGRLDPRRAAAAGPARSSAAPSRRGATGRSTPCTVDAAARASWPRHVAACHLNDASRGRLDRPDVEAPS